MDSSPMIAGQVGDKYRRQVQRGINPARWHYLPLGTAGASVAQP